MVDIDEKNYRQLADIALTMQRLHIDTQALAITVGSLIVEDGKHIDHYAKLVDEMQETQHQLKALLAHFTEEGDRGDE